MRQTIEYLNDILESIEKINKYIMNTTEEEFYKSDQIQDAIIRRLEVIGEAATNLPKELREEHPEIQWSDAIGMRNILAHEYFDNSPEIIWDTTQNSLPKFKKQVQLLYEKELELEKSRN